MHISSYQNMQRFTEKYLGDYAEKRTHILDIGSQDVNGTYKGLFKKKDWVYKGLDICPGKNVDIVVKDIYKWREIQSESFEIVISGQAFEHIEYFWLTMQEIARVLKPGGLCCIIAPSSGVEHRYPVDCWRFYSDGMSALAHYVDFEVLEVYTQREAEIGGAQNLWQDSVLVGRKKPGNFVPQTRMPERKGVLGKVKRVLGIGTKPR